MLSFASIVQVLFPSEPLVGISDSHKKYLNVENTESFLTLNVMKGAVTKVSFMSDLTKKEM